MQLRYLLLALLFIPTTSWATSIELDPARGQTLEHWAEHPDRAVTDILLKSGDHGRPTLMGLKNVLIHGEGFDPVIGHTLVIYSNNVTFQHLKWRGLRNGDTHWSNALVYIDGTAPNTKFENCNFAAVDDTSKWSPADWINLPYGQLIFSNSPGAVFANNEMFNTYNVMSINDNGWTVTKNSMHDFVNDGMDFRGSNITISDNRIFDSRDVPDNTMHADGIQGMAAYGNIPQPYTNVLITGNFVDAGTKTKSGMQGISAFDGRWKNVVITNNYVRPRAYHGITWMGVDDITIQGNTVDQFRNSRGVPIEHYPDLPKPWIEVNSGDGHPSTGLKVGPNVTPQYAGDSIAAMRPRPERLPLR